jgi:hypothetical protein
MLDTQMPRNSQRDGEPALVDKDKERIKELETILETKEIYFKSATAVLEQENQRLKQGFADVSLYIENCQKVMLPVEAGRILAIIGTAIA